MRVADAPAQVEGEPPTGVAARPALLGGVECHLEGSRLEGDDPDQVLDGILRFTEFLVVVGQRGQLSQKEFGTTVQ